MTRSLILYQHKKTEDYLVQRFADSTGVGKFISISASEMQVRGLEIVLKCLGGELVPTDGEKPESSAFSKEEERTFNRSYRGVSVRHAGSETLRIGILRRQRAGYVVRKGEVIQLSRPYTNDEFIILLSRAFAEF